MRSLDRTVAARLAAAGIRPDDPALVKIREWNAAAIKSGRYRVELRRGQFGKTRVISNA